MSALGWYLLGLATLPTILLVILVIALATTPDDQTLVIGFGLGEDDDR